jgi:PAS domain S-box-containing protein
MDHPLQILILEDSITDAELIQRVLLKANVRCRFHLSVDKNSFLKALEEFSIDLIISDNSLPQFDAREALKITRQRFYHLPFILVTGTVSEEFAADIIKEGADDYILKDRMARLPAAVDATIRKRKALKEIADYKYAIDQSAIVAITDQKGIIIYANDNFCKISKYSTKELIGQDHRIVNSGYHSKDFIRNLWITIAKGEIWRGELKNKAKDGTIYWVDTTIIPFLNKKGKPYQYVAIKTDISQRKKAEEKLTSNEKRFRALIENSSDAIVMNDADSNILYQSPSVTKILGYELDERKGKKVMDYVNPGNLKDFRDLYKELKKKPGTPIPFQWQFLHKIGNYIWLEGVITNLINDPDVKAYVANYRDITERKEAEQQKEFDSNNLKALINNTNDLMWSVDKDLKLITFNDSFNNIIKVMSGKSLSQGDDILSTQFTKEELVRYKNFYERALSGEAFTIVDYFDYPIQLWTEISFYPIRKGDKVIGTACFSRDITEKKKAEEEIKKSNERFEMVVSATNDIIWDWDIGTNKFWWNENYYSHFGYDKKNTVLNVSSWQDGVHPDDKKRVMSGIRECLENHQDFWTDEYRFLKVDGTIAFVLDCGYILYTEKEKPYRMVGAMLDITERKKAEEQLRISFAEKQALAERMSTILNTLPANIALLDAKGFIIDVNDSWRKFADENDFMGNNYCIGDDYIKIAEEASGEDENDGKAVASGIRDVIENNAKEFVYEYPCHSPNVKRWFRMVVTPLQEKEYAGAVVMHIDISEVRRLEQERMESKIEEQKKIARAMLNAQEKERNAIGAELHDNVNQILAATNLFLSIAKKHPEKSLEHIESSMNNIQYAIEQNRRITHELVAPDFEEIRLTEMINSLTNNMLKKTGIDVHIDISVLNEGLLSDEQKLSIYRIAQEQCTNIIKYAEAKTVKISLSTVDDFFNMIIADDGKGMETGKKAGGIGLRNIKGRLSIFNGEADVITSAGAGFILEIAIPLQ